jgi:predicted nucleic acid-binding protein
VTAFVLDNSVTMRWCFEDTATAYSEDILRQLASGTEASAPVLWLYEVTAVLAKEQRRGALSPHQAADFLKALKSFPIAIDPDGTDQILTRVYQLAVEHRLTGYDAAYLELALRKSLPLASLDDELRKACLAAGGLLFT